MIDTHGRATFAPQAHGLSAPLWVVGALLMALSLSPGCTQPCDDLEALVCRDARPSDRCELLRDPIRRAHLSSQACERMLEHLAP